MRVAIIGAGGHGQVAADIFLSRLNRGSVDKQPIGFLDDDPTLHHDSILGLSVLGTIAQLPNIAHDGVIVAIGNNHIRQKICQWLQSQNEQLVSAIHPSAIIGSGVEIGVGTMICAGVVINTGVHIGQGVILNTSCTVDHHNCIDDYVHIGPGAHLGGDVEIGEGTLVGIGATIMPQRQIGTWSVVGAGAVVTKDIPAGITAVGVPAQVIK